jgi:uncharacterized membrane protein (UPF0127 family)
MDTCEETTRREYVVVNVNRGSTVAQRVCIASDSSARRKGLLGIEHFTPGAGLWIAPCEAIHTFGMKMPIDAIFLDHHFQVRKLRRNLSPGRISLCLSAASVLEVEAGTAARSGTAVGDRLSFKLPEQSDVLTPFGR